MVTVLTETAEIQADAPAGGALWLSPQDMAAVTGWMLKPEGLCKDDVCIPVPAGHADKYVHNDKVNATEFWSLMGKTAVSTDAGDVWFLGEGAQTRNEHLLSLEAPDFTLPDFDGKLHSLTDYRRQRVLLITWASW